MNTFINMQVKSPFTTIFPRYNRWHAIQALNQLDDFLILDTETTGIGKGAELCELAIIDYKSGIVLFNSLICPCKLAEYEVSKAREITGITSEALSNAPWLDTVWNEVLDILKSKHITSFNTSFDLRMIRNSAQVWHLEVPPLDATCLMQLTTAWFNLDYWLNLDEAAELLGIDRETLDGDRHRALYDALVTRAIVQKMKALL